MRVGCQYERVRYSGWYNFTWNDPCRLLLSTDQQYLIGALLQYLLGPMCSEIFFRKVD